MFSFASQKMASGEAAVQPIMTSNPAIALRFHFAPPLGRVAELGSLIWLSVCQAGMSGEHHIFCGAFWLQPVG